MALPKFFEFFTPVLQTLNDSGSVMTVKDIRLSCYALMKLTEEELSQMLPSGRQSTVDNRINWSITYLKKADLILQQGYARYSITDAGKKLLSSGIPISLKDLEASEKFRKFHQTNANDDTADNPAAVSISESTPQDMITDAIKQIETDLAEQLLEQIMNQDPKFFEDLVMDLLKKMGYGGAFDKSVMVVGHNGDEGIDGIIREDKLGFDSIYVQAKRWDPEKNTVGRPEIMQFVGALAGQGASKGLFITTAKYSQQARQYAEKQLQQKIVLIDGEMLTRLMIDNGVGVSTESVHYIKRLDMDYFNR